MKPTLWGCIILFFICCSKEETQCKTIARIIGNGEFIPYTLMMELPI